MNKSVNEWLADFLIKASSSSIWDLSEAIDLTPKVFLVANLFSCGWGFGNPNANIFEIQSTGHWCGFSLTGCIS